MKLWNFKSLLSRHRIENSLLSIILLLLVIIGGDFYIEGLSTFAIIVITPTIGIFIAKLIFIMTYGYFFLLNPRERFWAVISLALLCFPILIGGGLFIFSSRILEISCLIMVVEGISMFAVSYVFSENKLPIPQIATYPLRTENEPEAYNLQLWWICNILGRLGLGGILLGLMILFKVSPK